jgi:FkbM family methyltransferase
MAQRFIKAIEPFFRAKAVSLVDVGAYRGETFEFFFQSRLDIHEAHLFEPNPTSFVSLQQRFERHPKAHRLHFHNVALGRAASYAVLEGHGDMTRVRTLVPHPSEVPNFSAPNAVKTTTLDEAAQTFALPRISILKVDVEGQETDVLEGARNLLTEGKVDVIYIEAGLDERCHSLTHFQKLMDFLLPLGFRIFKFFEQKHEWPDDSPLLRRTNIAFMREQFAKEHPYRLTNALFKAEQTNKEYASTLEDKQRLIAEQKLALRHAREKSEEYARELKHKQRRLVENQNRQLAEKEQTLQQVEKQNAAYARELENQNRQLAEKEQTLQQVEKQNAAYARELENQNRQLAESKRTIDELRAASRAQTRKLCELRDMLTFRLGKVIVDGSRSIPGVLLIPYRMLAVYRDFRRRRSGTHSKQRRCSSSSPLLHDEPSKTLPAPVRVGSTSHSFRDSPVTQIPREDICSAADGAYRNRDFVSALVLYTHLSESFPRDKSYQICCKKALKAASREFGQVPIINTKKTTACGKNLRLIHTLISLGYPKEKLAKVVEQLPRKRDRFALGANLQAGEDPASWQRCVNLLLAHYGLRNLKLEPAGFLPNVMHNIRFEEANPSPRDRGLVTICISAHNSAGTLSYAIESVLRQDYPNFELFVLDDASTDGTAEVARHFAAKDNRITVIVSNRNRGTYWNRSLALSRAKGVFFTTLDADDICHPQRIPLQLAFLDQEREALGVFGLWFRIDRVGRLTYRNAWGGVIVHEAVATFLFRREPVVSRVGYYDPVKISADTEYLARIRKVFGKQSVRLLHKPLAIALAHDQSLTANRSSGIDNYFGLSQPRQDYRKSWMQWHKATDPEKLFVPFPESAYLRPFAAPGEILVPLD